MRCVVALAVVVAARQAGACDAAEVTRLTTQAERYEARHEMGEAIRVRTALVACARPHEGQRDALALAEDQRAIGDYEAAAFITEQAVRASSVSADLVVAMEHAVEARVAHGQFDQALSDARWLITHDAGWRAALDVGTALEAHQDWARARAWYNELLARSALQGVPTLHAQAAVGLGRSLEALHLPGATEAYERARADYPRVGGVTPVREAALASFAYVPEPPPSPPAAVEAAPAPLAPTAPPPLMVAEEQVNGVASHDASAPIEGRSAPQPEWEAYAEATFRVARTVSLRCQATPLQPPAGQTQRAYDAWATARLTPYLRYQSACIATVTDALAEVLAIGVPRWEVSAAALMADRYHQMAQIVRDMPLPPGGLREEDLCR